MTTVAALEQCIADTKTSCEKLKKDIEAQTASITCARFERELVGRHEVLQGGFDVMSSCAWEDNALRRLHYYKEILAEETAELAKLRARLASAEKAA